MSPSSTTALRSGEYTPLHVLLSSALWPALVSWVLSNQLSGSLFQQSDMLLHELP